MNKQELATKTWESANKMSPKIEANRYKEIDFMKTFAPRLSNRVFMWTIATWNQMKHGGKVLHHF